MQSRPNPFFVMAGLYFAVGLTAVLGKLTVDAGFVDALPRLRWLTIHFVTIGGMTQALFGALPTLLGVAGADSSGASTGDRWAQWLLLNGGYPLILIGMVTGNALVAVIGATGILGALGLLIRTIHRFTRDADGTLQRYYRTAPWFLVVGVFAAFGMLLNLHGPGGYFGSIEAHVHANVWGFLALVVAATLQLVVPASTGADLASPRLTHVTYWGLTVGAVGLVAGPWLAVHLLTFAGLATYVVGTVALLVNVVGTVRAGRSVGDTRTGYVLGAYLWLVFPVPWAPFVLLFPDVLPGGPIEFAAVTGLVFGWMLQLAAAFLPVVVAASGRTGDADRNLAAVAREHSPSRVGLVTVNLGMFAIWLTAFPPFDPVSDPLSTAGFALVGVTWALFVRDLWAALVGVDGRAGEGPQTPVQTPADSD